MARNLFSVPIFFIVFRETLEAAIIISVLLGLVEQLVDTHHHELTGPSTTQVTTTDDKGEKTSSNEASAEEYVDDQMTKRRLVRKMRIQIFLGSATGFLIAAIIGAVFIAIWFTQASNLWQKSEEIWEGSFYLIASIIIFVMGITMLKMDRAKIKWRVKLAHAFEGKHVDSRTRTGQWVLFILPLITVLREGIEAIVFVGGVSLGQNAESIPIAAIVGIIAGLVCGFVIYAFASRSTLTVFLIIMTNFLLLIGAGLFSKAVWAFQENAFNHLLGGDVDDSGGDGPGSFNVRGNVWHLDCCNPDNNFDSGGWQIFGAIFGWTNSATLGSVLSYVFYWLAVIVTLIVIKFREGRTTLLGKESAAGARRRERREVRVEGPPDEKTEGAEAGVQELPR
ncbi:iron permease FTR1 [Auriscalpium vulgare]|uniref:Iron permease FTR1 n=1 Tax=Auriscalpium vulgare TaxID=40419 RepID=A0ACB8S9P3_9AGAM|nr:iron permease FTR1 [Auriscalpium vulgare]